MLYELYKKIYFYLYDHLIVAFLINNFKDVRFTSIRHALQEAFVLKCTPRFYQHPTSTTLFKVRIEGGYLVSKYLI